jgi:hypothetical protein
MNTRKLSNRDWQEIENRIEKRLSGWKGKMLSTGGRLVLINSVLSSLPMFMLSFWKFHEVCYKKWTILGRGFIGRMTKTN